MYVEVLTEVEGGFSRTRKDKVGANVVSDELTADCYCRFKITHRAENGQTAKSENFYIKTT